MRRHDSDLWPGGNSVSATPAAASARIALPVMDAGNNGEPGATANPKRVRVATDSVVGIWIKFGDVTVSVSVADGIYISRDSGAETFYVDGQTHVASIDPSVGGDNLNVTPLNE